MQLESTMTLHVSSQADRPRPTGPRRSWGHRLARFISRHTPYILLVPSTVILTAVLAYPWIWSFVVSFMQWSPISPDGPSFIGIQNYVTIFSSPEFWRSLWLTLLLVLLTVPAELVLGFLLAYILNTDLPGRGLFQTVLIMPMMVVPVMAGVAWLVLLHPVYGTIPYYFDVLGLPQIGWMTSPQTAIFTVALVEIWRNTPMVMLILFAGLRSLPPELADASRVDGATALQHIFHIVLPNLKPFILFCLLIMTMFELRTFDTVFALFESGGPGQGAQVLGIYLYERFTNSYDFGISSALAYVLLALTIILSFLFAKGAIKGAAE